jgi:acyl-CoA synthetase (AMP-forming)/AMP-acid ligase II
MDGYSDVPDPAVSLAHGIPLSEEPGLGTLTLPGWLREVTTRFAAREAIAQPRPDGTTERWTYAELWNRAETVARALLACGTSKGTRIGILMSNRAEFIAAFFGAALAGGVPTPLSTFSTQTELDQLLTASTVSVLLIEPQVLKKDFLGIVLACEPGLATASPGAIRSQTYPYLRHVAMLDRTDAVGAVETWDAFLARGAAVTQAHVAASAATVTPADPGALFFSSGSTGKPKGILNAQRGISIQLWRWPRIFGLPEDCRCWCANGFFWSGPIGMAFGGALSVGGTLVLQSTFQPEETLHLWEAERVTSPFGWPHQWAQLEAASNWLIADLSSIKHIVAESSVARHPSVDTDWPEPTRIYGNTETFTLSSGYCSGTPEEILKGAHGFPLPGMTIKVVDPFTGALMPMGERGELAVKGATLMMGYLGVPLDETLDETGFFRTGDGGYLDADGRVYWEGRLNDIIKTGGANVSPVEIDNLLIQHPAVKIVQTIGVPDDLLGERVVSCIGLHEGALLDEAAVKAFAREQLASFKVPRQVLFLAESEFTQTGSAKVKTADLRKLAAGKLAAS